MKLETKDYFFAIGGAALVCLALLVPGTFTQQAPIAFGIAAFIFFVLIWMYRNETVQVANNIEAYLKAIVEDREDVELKFSSKSWDAASKLLRSVQMYLKISRQSLEDRKDLYEEMELKLLENQKRLYDTEDQLKKNEQKLQKSEYKVLEYMLALQHINVIQRRIQGLLSLGPLLEESTNLLVSHLCAHRGCFLRLDLQAQKLKMISPVNMPIEADAHLDDAYLLEIFKAAELDQPPVEDEMSEATVPILKLNAESGAFYGVEFKSALLVPVWIDKELWGVFFFADKEERIRMDQDESDALAAFSESDELVLQNVVAFLQKDLKNAYLFEMATIDSLSQLYVRRYFLGRMDDELKRLQRNPDKLSLLILDIDHFKRVNDTFGHLVGDEVIRAVSDEIQSQIRHGIDLPSRYGGEEIVIMLPQTAKINAQIVAERMRDSISKIQLDSLASGPNPQITVSIGVSCYPEDGDDVKSLLDNADQALYRAKETGRNRVCVAATQEPDSE